MRSKLWPGWPRLNRVLVSASLPGLMSKSMRAGALAYRVRSGRLEFLLITSRNSGRWIIPKGRCEYGEALHDAAAREAYEEAGITGVVDRKLIGRFSDKPVVSHPATVLLYPLRVTQQANSWPEKGQRKLKWVSSGTALRGVSRPLAKLIDMFAMTLIGSATSKRQTTRQ